MPLSSSLLAVANTCCYQLRALSSGRRPRRSSCWRRSQNAATGRSPARRRALMSAADLTSSPPNPLWFHPRHCTGRGDHAPRHTAPPPAASSPPPQPGQPHALQRPRRWRSAPKTRRGGAPPLLPHHRRHRRHSPGGRPPRPKSIHRCNRTPPRVSVEASKQPGTTDAREWLPSPGMHPTLLCGASVAVEGGAVAAATDRPQCRPTRHADKSTHTSKFADMHGRLICGANVSAQAATRSAANCT